jgi:hypothetical protein
VVEALLLEAGEDEGEDEVDDDGEEVAPEEVAPELEVSDDGAFEWLQPNRASRAIGASPRTIFWFRMFFTPDST